MIGGSDAFDAEAYAYLDYAATAPLCEEALEAMRPYLATGRAGVALGANANSLHTPGRSAFSALEHARTELSHAVGAHRPSEISFTSGATESDNAAIIGIARAEAARRAQKGRPVEHPRIVTLAIEHDAVLEPVRFLEHEGFSATYLAPDRGGFLAVEALEQVLDDDVVLVSVQAANSEIGAEQDIAALARASHGAGALFHTDATQALGKLCVNVEEWGVDAASFSSHKVGGPKGVGALYVRARTPYRAYLMGGGQEAGARSGTQNVCGAVGFAAAARAAVEAQPAERQRLAALRDMLYGELSGVTNVVSTVDVSTAPERYLPNIVNVCVDGMESETLILRLDIAGFGVSGGSACSSNSLGPSHVLTALGISRDRALGALRVSMGRYTTDDDAKRFAAAFREVVEAGV